MPVTDNGGSRVPCSARDARYLALAALRRAVSGGAGGATCAPPRHQCGVYCVYEGLRVVVGPAHVMAPAVASRWRAADSICSACAQGTSSSCVEWYTCTRTPGGTRAMPLRGDALGRPSSASAARATAGGTPWWTDASSAGTDAKTTTVGGRRSPRAAASDTAVHRQCTLPGCVRRPRRAWWASACGWPAVHAAARWGPGAQSGAGLRC